MTDIFMTEDTDDTTLDGENTETHWYTDCSVPTDLISGEAYSDIPHIDQQRDYIKI